MNDRTPTTPKGLRPCAAACGVLVAMVSVSCGALLGLEDRRQTASDGGQPASTDTGTSTDDPCAVIGTPARPSMPDDGQEGDFVFALSRIDLGLDGGLPFDLNLDRTCTCPGPDSCQRSELACDDEAGHDNASAAAMATLARLGVFSEATLNQNLRAGISGALLRVEGYNGQPDDPRVTVSFYGAIRFEGDRPTGRPDDRWTVDEASLRGSAGNYGPRYADGDAFVSHGTLVASFEFPVDIGGDPKQAPLRLDLKAGAIVARIDTSTGLLRGVLAGRWPTSSLLATVETLPDPTAPGRRMCRDTAAFGLIRDLACSSSDVTSDPTLDNKGSSCNALSTSVGFEAIAAAFGTIGVRPPPAPSCVDGGAATPPRCDDR